MKPISATGSFVDIQAAEQGPPDVRLAERELIVVEGESAWKSVVAIRDASHQAVLAMQGKPINAAKASQAAVARNPWAAQFHRILTGRSNGPCSYDQNPNPDAAPYHRIVLLFDPDADGIHCEALMLLLVWHLAADWVDQQRVWCVKAPAYEVQVQATGEVGYADHPLHLQAIQRAAEKQGAILRSRPYRGLASIPAAVLRARCVRPESRRQSCVTRDQIEAIRQTIGHRRPR